MKRSLAIKKLANAIRAYRGLSENPPTPETETKWRITPQPHKSKDVINYLKKLGIDSLQGMKDVDGFATRDDFDVWLNKLEKHE